MKLFLSFLFLLVGLSSHSQNLLTGQQLSRTFNLKKDSTSGTSFLVSSNKFNYWVTAKHLFPNVKNGDLTSFLILQDSTWAVNNGIVLLHRNPLIDIVVLQTNDTTKIDAITLEQTSPAIGDDGLFLGFPYGLKTVDKGFVNNRFPFPLVKKCTFSGGLNENGISILFLDGHNNPGFSGGPIFFRNTQNQNDRRLYLLGVISGYVNQYNKLNTPFGTMNYIENSGIMMAFPSSYIKEILIQNGLK